MKKGYFLVGIIVLSVILVFSGCGVAQEEYDTVVAERDAALAEAAGLAEDLEASQAEVVGLEDDLEAARDEVAGLQDDLEEAQAEATNLESDLEEAQTELTGLTVDLNEALDDFEALESELASVITPVIPRMMLASCLLELETLGSKFDEGLVTQEESDEQGAVLLIALMLYVGMCDDDVLSQHLSDFMDAADQNQEHQAICCLIDLYDRLIELIDQDLEALESLTH